MFDVVVVLPLKSCTASANYVICNSFYKTIGDAFICRLKVQRVVKICLGGAKNIRLARLIVCLGADFT